MFDSCNEDESHRSKVKSPGSKLVVKDNVQIKVQEIGFVWDNFETQFKIRMKVHMFDI